MNGLICLWFFQNLVILLQTEARPLQTCLNKSQKSLNISLAELFNYISSKRRDTISFLLHKVSQSLCVHLLAK